MTLHAPPGPDDSSMDRIDWPLPRHWLEYRSRAIRGAPQAAFELVIDLDAPRERWEALYQMIAALAEAGYTLDREASGPEDTTRTSSGAAAKRDLPRRRARQIGSSP